jgi:hypothetical protein
VFGADGRVGGGFAGVQGSVALGLACGAEREEGERGEDEGEGSGAEGKAEEGRGPRSSAASA